MDRDPVTLTNAEIENIEKLSIRWATQALLDFAPIAYDEFRNSPDDADGVAEDVTQEALNDLKGFAIRQRRLYGTVDYRQARYVILPEYMVRQALFIDSKAEKSASSGRIQISQTSLHVRFSRPDGARINVPGGLPTIIDLADQTSYLSTTLFVHYHYGEPPEGRELKAILLAALPNGKLESDYVPSCTDSIWNVGPDSPARGERQRARISFRKLEQKRSWRVQRINFNPTGQVSFVWHDGVQ
ncbi:MAG: SfiI family type II restriction endonuclease [Gammaproteobacteria bacterium]